MSPQLAELLDLIARWVHVIAGIMWIGNSMLFNFLDRNLRKRPEADSYGDIWLIHSGAFYQLEKNRGLERPGTLHAAPWRLAVWFKWQAYTTWLTGALLLVVVYYLGGRALLVDPAIADLPHGTAVAISVASIVGTWAIYEAIWRFIGTRWYSAATWLSVILFVGVVTWLDYQISGRAGLVHAGAILGTIMAANVFFVIMPSQRELVAALETGREASQAIADRAKTRSIHNNYITFPVLVLMVSGHFPSLYSGRHWAESVFILVAAGALVRHFMNVRFTSPRWGYGLTATVAIVTLLLASRLQVGPFELPQHPGGGRMAEADSASIKMPDSVSFDVARRVIDRRCASCHSLTPSDKSYGVTPAGVAFDTREQIMAMSERIRTRAVLDKTMPPGNKTLMTDVERAILAKWIAAGAKTP